MIQLSLEKNLSTTNEPSRWSLILQQLLDGQSLSVSQASDLMCGWLTEAIPPVLSGAILAAIQAKGVSVEELLGMVEALHSQSVKPNLRDHFVNSPLVDTCGTGGDGASTFNISTSVAFVTAACGLKVAKHGNRSASGKTGSADVLEALGINLKADAEKAQAALDAVGITFLFAPDWHPALSAIAPLRKTLKVRTVFNLLGPLLNPLRPTGQVIGVNNPTLIETFAKVLNHLGTRRAITLHGREKLDEAGLGDKTDLAVLSNRQIHRLELDPRDLGLNPAPISTLRGGDVQENAEILKAVLQGKGTLPQQDAVALNTALALYVGEYLTDSGNYTNTFSDAVILARGVLQSGEPWRKLEQLAKFLA
ncbi:anthranilate phosphoribosyltransferase [Aetokthonos hydrillicola]|jgi:anthranilate phosphoribosyltransferase|uniref:anthranilate phosphoribosyltransferase n=1 Tax=Aetokthonos hydrillicola TaxID=1550245 RepID=UPI001ABA3466|nr:anthranilate phosphoribosyltransferase [Aetokthonos hydrillicola]MBO3458233.1 anthranilate phosphoribosyltransferase [Aetokthonos hydrillicola CCALA 1050]MBW4584452.1 anthranilate phosphoribosyltransferase [Aetokthonos hydrillicola CCALA 1050]